MKIRSVTNQIIAKDQKQYSYFERVRNHYTNLNQTNKQLSNSQKTINQNKKTTIKQLNQKQKSQPKISIQNTNCLIKLKKQHNSILRAPNIHCQNSTMLDLSHNNLYKLSQTQFTTKEVNTNLPTNLKILNLSFNSFKEIQKCILKLTNLQILDMSHNKIHNIHFNTEQALPALRQFNLSHNLLTQQVQIIPLFELIKKGVKIELKANKVYHKFIRKIEMMNIQISQNSKKLKQGDIGVVKTSRIQDKNKSKKNNTQSAQKYKEQNIRKPNFHLEPTHRFGEEQNKFFGSQEFNSFLELKLTQNSQQNNNIIHKKYNSFKTKQPNSLNDDNKNLQQIIKYQQSRIHNLSVNKIISLNRYRQYFQFVNTKISLSEKQIMKQTQNNNLHQNFYSIEAMLMNQSSKAVINDFKEILKECTKRIITIIQIKIKIILKFVSPSKINSSQNNNELLQRINLEELIYIKKQVQSINAEINHRIKDKLQTLLMKQEQTNKQTFIIQLKPFKVWMKAYNRILKVNFGEIEEWNNIQQRYCQIYKISIKPIKQESKYKLQNCPKINIKDQNNDQIKSNKQSNYNSQNKKDQINLSQLLFTDQKNKISGNNLSPNQVSEQSKFQLSSANSKPRQNIQKEIDSLKQQKSYSYRKSQQMQNHKQQQLVSPQKLQTNQNIQFTPCHSCTILNHKFTILNKKLIEEQHTNMRNQQIITLQKEKINNLSQQLYTLNSVGVKQDFIIRQIESLQGQNRRPYENQQKRGIYKNKSGSKQSTNKYGIVYQNLLLQQAKSIQQMLRGYPSLNQKIDIENIPTNQNGSKIGSNRQQQKSKKHIFQSKKTKNLKREILSSHLRKEDIKKPTKSTQQPVKNTYQSKQRVKTINICHQKMKQKGCDQIKVSEFMLEQVQDGKSSSLNKLKTQYFPSNWSNSQYRLIQVENNIQTEQNKNMENEQNLVGDWKVKVRKENKKHERYSECKFTNIKSNPHKRQADKIITKSNYQQYMNFHLRNTIAEILQLRRKTEIQSLLLIQQNQTERINSRNIDRRFQTLGIKKHQPIFTHRTNQVNQILSQLPRSKLQESRLLNGISEFSGIITEN